jgi:hypothetical protein
VVALDAAAQKVEEVLTHNFRLRLLDGWNDLSHSLSLEVVKFPVALGSNVLAVGAANECGIVNAKLRLSATVGACEIHLFS